MFWDFFQSFLLNINLFFKWAVKKQKENIKINAKKSLLRQIPIYLSCYTAIFWSLKHNLIKNISKIHTRNKIKAQQPQTYSWPGIWPDNQLLWKPFLLACCRDKYLLSYIDIKVNFRMPSFRHINCNCGLHGRVLLKILFRTNLTTDNFSLNNSQFPSVK